DARAGRDRARHPAGVRRARPVEPTPRPRRDRRVPRRRALPARRHRARPPGRARPTRRARVAGRRSRPAPRSRARAPVRVRDGAEGRVSAPVLEVRGLSKRFGRVHALAEVELELGAGEIVVVLGPTGAGKTTLLRTLAGLEAPDAGTLRLHGRDVTHA